MINDSVFIEDLTTAELNKKIKEGYSTVLIYSGGTEATGPHVVLGKHNFKLKSYAQRVAKGVGKTLVVPIIPFAPNHISLKKFPGTISLEEQTFYNVNKEIALSMISSGFTHIILMCDHYNSQQPLRQLADTLASSYRNQKVDVYYAGSGYAKAREIIEESIKKRNIAAGGHGGHWDVSEIMSISKKHVRPDLFDIGDTIKGGNAQLDHRGVSGDPRKANTKDGRQYADLRVKLYIEEIKNHIKAFRKEE
ncbi:creatininase family protein [Aquimarina aquimarini]|uniref:creatininase family protein n=1 Tax=Aquimarina aquimarini TaxID=1191734 RepID=UPI00131ED6A8|nr:creatininase family protein [Aquimarina aquimarini]